MQRRDSHALVAGSMMPAGEVVRGRKSVRVAAPKGDRRLAAAMAAAAGLRAELVLPGEPADLEILSSGSGNVTAARPARVFYDIKVLQALVPGSDIQVGSLRALMPGVGWIADPGGMVVTVPSKASNPAPVPPAEDPSRIWRPAERASGPVTVQVSSLPKSPLGVRGPVRRVALNRPEIRGVQLKDGDVVVDQTGDRWFVRSGDLWSHKTATLAREDVIIDGRVLRAARAGTRLVGAAKNDRVEVVLLNSNDQAVYGTVTDDDAVEWQVRLDVNPSIVSDPRATCFGARLAATADQCYAAGGVWDRPCDVDVECPYYDSRTGRGRCIAGTCEMPLGVGNKSFRVADPDTPPLCNGDGDDPWCPAEAVRRR